MHVFTSKVFHKSKSHEKNTLENAGLFQPNLGKIWTNPNVGLKMQLKMYS